MARRRRRSPRAWSWAPGSGITGRKRRIGGTGVTVDLVATGDDGSTWFFVVCGAHTSRRGGLMRIDEVWRALGRASALRGRCPEARVVLLAAGLPAPRSDGDLALRAAGPAMSVDVVDLLSADARDRLAAARR